MPVYKDIYIKVSFDIGIRNGTEVTMSDFICKDIRISTYIDIDHHTKLIDKIIKPLSKYIRKLYRLKNDIRFSLYQRDSNKYISIVNIITSVNFNFLLFKTYKYQITYTDIVHSKEITFDDERIIVQ